MKKKIKVSVALDRELVERLDGIAGVTNASRSKIIEDMIRDGIATGEQMARLMANPEARKMMLQGFGNPEVLRAVANAMNEKLPPGMEKLMLETLEGAGQAVAEAKVAEFKKGKGKKP